MSKARGTTEPPQQPTRICLGWDEPFACVVADWLWSARERLPRRLVVVPTRESGRRLRELLLARAAQEGRNAVLGPRLATPEDFFRPEHRMPDCICWAGWLQAFDCAHDSEVANLFPSGLSQRDQAWRLGVVRQIGQVRELLASVDVGFQQVAEALEQERERWLELATLEAAAAAVWESWGLADPVAMKRSKAQNPVVPPGVHEVIIAGVPDPTPLAVAAWDRLCAAGFKVTVLVGAPDKLADAFDPWGRPRVDFWTARDRHSSPQPDRFYLAADAVGVAEAVVQSCAARSNREIAVGACDGDFVPALSRRFKEAGWVTYDPEGLPVARDGWPSLLERIADAIENPDDFGALARMARHPVVWQTWLEERGARSALAELDRWEKDTCACAAKAAVEKLTSSDDAHLAAVGSFLAKIQAFVALGASGREGAFTAQLASWFAQASREVRDWANEELGGWPLLTHSGSAARPGAQKRRGAITAPSAGFSLAQRLRWLATSLASVKQNTDHSEAVLPLQGWLELLYESSPHLVLAALHEGKVPEAPASNPLICEPVREHFGLRDRKSRFARDVFIYTGLLEGRRASGSVTVVNAQVDLQGEPCKPSRVLLQTSSADLPSRVQHFIREQPDVPLQPTPAWSRGDWLLRPPPGVPRNREWKHVSPSTLKAYLECPTRFYFTQVLACERFEPFRQELDGGAFGELLHRVFQLWGEDKQACQETNPSKLRTYWHTLLKEVVKDSFGSNLPPVVQLQVLSAEERLAAFSEVQAKQCKTGWRIIELEKRYLGEVQFEGVPLKVRVDRIDRHEDGRVRVIDYKTARKGIKPDQAHLRRFDPETCPAPLIPQNGNDRVWVDLQLPLYALTVKRALNLGTLPKAYYALLPEAVGETELIEFEDMDRLIEDANEWAKEATRRIVAGVFWPPTPKVKYDDFAAAAPEGLLKALGPGWTAFLSAPQSPREVQPTTSEPAYLKL